MSSLPSHLVASLSSVSLSGSGLSRAAPVPVEDRPEGFDAAFDAQTLWYDAVQIEDRVHVVLPRLFNLRPVINDASLSLEGAEVPDGDAARILRHKRHRRHEILELAAASTMTGLSVRSGRWQGSSGISPDQASLFEGLNTSVHISRDNDLRWIADWARFHVSAHGLEGMLVMDNGSQSYPAEAIAEALSDVGLKRVVVLKVPHPYGPPRSKAHPGSAKFLQPAMLNLARLRFLRRARAVLNADIDELVWTKGASIFDAAVGSRLGYVSFNGQWRLPAPERRRQSAPAHVHGDHRMKRRDGKDCPRKYCIVPQGPLRHLSWDVHRPDWALLPSRWMHPDFGYWHCQAITTNWKVHDRLKARAPGPEDPETVAAIARHLE